MATKNILIADADKLYRRQLRDFILTKDDFAIFDVGSGGTAVNVAAKTKPSVVLLDIMLPDMNGIEVCRKIKTNEQSKNTPVIIHTSKTGMHERLRAFLAGANRYIEKPCELDIIYDCLQGFITPYTRNNNLSVNDDFNRMAF
jgi:DNA-binding response OmpR family regulator